MAPWIHTELIPGDEAFFPCEFQLLSGHSVSYKTPEPPPAHPNSASAWCSLWNPGVLSQPHLCLLLHLTCWVLRQGLTMSCKLASNSQHPPAPTPGFPPSPFSVLSAEHQALQLHPGNYPNSLISISPRPARRRILLSKVF